MGDSRRKYNSGIIFNSGDSSMGQVVQESSKLCKTTIGRPRDPKNKKSVQTVLEEEKRI